MKSRALISKGFTLIEVMIALAILSIVVTAVYTTFISQNNNALIQEDVADVQQNARIALDLIARDIRGSGVAMATQSVTTAGGITTVYNAISTVTTSASSGTTNNYVVPVSTTLGFSAGDYVRVVSSINQSLDRNGASVQITAPPAGTSLTIGGNQPVPGDLIFKCYNQACGSGAAQPSYVYVLNGTQLQRITFSGPIPTVNNNVIADDVVGLNVNTANYPLINIALTTQTSKNVSKINGAARTRILTASFLKKN